MAGVQIGLDCLLHRNVSPPSSSPSAIPHTEENPGRQLPSHVRVSVSQSLLQCGPGPYRSEDPQLGKREGEERTVKGTGSPIQMDQPGGDLDVSWIHFGSNGLVAVELTLNLGLPQRSLRHNWR